MKTLSIFALAASAAIVAMAAPASAAVILPSFGSCSVTDISPTASLCNGNYLGNGLNSNNLATQNYALNQLGSSLVVTNVSFTNLPKIADLAATSDRTALDFPGVSMLYGITIVGIHWGGQHDYTSFYKFDAGVNGIASATILANTTKTSNAVLYSTGIVPVPEPASWALMIAGFAVTGTAMRRRSMVSAIQFG